MARILHADGRTTELLDATLELDAMQRIVGGFIEIVYLGGPPNARHVLIVNEDGLREQLPQNVRATMLYRGNPPRHGEVIVGDAIEATVLDAGEDTERIV